MSRFGSFALSLVLASVATSSVAHADGPPGEQPLLAPRAQPDAATPYNPNVALGLSLGVTLAGAGAMVIGAQQNNETLGMVGVTGVFLGPSAGHWYSHHYLTRGLGVRSLGVAAAFAGVVASLEACPLFSDEPCKDSVAGETLLILGGAAYVAGTIDDIVTAPGEARRRNGLIKNLTIAPVVTSRQAGFSIAGSF
ncbi:MAG: hypothetical protein K8W52_37220 [Deltaproteobacteria bacterium]|nr:hypothetical protein [Deltaproteobacteria bacterium]